MERAELSNKIAKLGLKKTELVSYLPISRSTLYIYINYYQANNLKNIDREDIIEFFDYILLEDTTKNDVLKYLLDNFDEKEVKNNQPKKFDEKDYGLEKNIVLLQKNLSLLKKAAGWDNNILSLETGISIEELERIENGDIKLSKDKAIALFSVLCKESRTRDQDDYLPVAISLIFDEGNLSDEEKENGLNVISLAANKSNHETDDDNKEEIKQEFKKDFKKYTGKKIAIGAVIGASVVIVGKLVLNFLKK